MLIGICQFNYSLAQLDASKYMYYGPNDGMPNGVVIDFVQDSIGRMWIGTLNGLTCFDGYDFKSFYHDVTDSTSIGSNQINKLAMLDNSHLLICHSNGLSKINIFTGIARRIDYYSFDASIKNQDVFTIYVENSNLWWIGSPEGLIKYLPHFPDSSVVHLPSKTVINDWELNMNKIISIQENKEDEDKLWILTLIGLTSFDKRTGTFQLLERLPGIRPTHVEEFHKYFSPHMNMIVDQNNELWIGSDGGGIFHVIPNTNTWTNYNLTDQKELSGGNIIIELHPLTDSTFYVGTRFQGLCTFNRSTQKFKCVERNRNSIYSLESESIPAIKIDRDGRTWVGMSEGIAIYDPYQHMFQVAMEDTLTTKIHKVFGSARGDTIFYGDRKGFNYRVPKTGAHFQKSDLDFGDFKKDIGDITDIFRSPSGELIFTASGSFSGGRGGIYFYNPARNSAYGIKSQIPYFSMDMTAVLSLSADTFLTGSEIYGLSLITRNQKDGVYDFNMYNRSLKDPNIRINALLKRKNKTILVGTNNGVIQVELGEMNDSIFLKETTIPESNISRSCGSVNDMVFGDENSFWVTTGEGLFKFSLSDTNHLHIPVDDLLPGAILDEILFDGQYIWVSSNNGLLQIDSKSQEVLVLAERDGLLQDRVDDIFITEDRQMLVATKNVVQSISLDSLERKLNSNPPTPFITEVMVGDQKRDHHQGITLKYPIREFSVNYVAVNYTHPELNQYQVRLKGDDDNWTNNKDRRFSSYNHLAPGHYTFEVKGKNHHGYWSNTTASLAVYVKPAYWETIWFKVLIGVALASIFYGLYRYRIYQVKRESRLVMEFNRRVANAETQALRAQMNPHFIFNALNSIKLFVMNKSPEKGGVYLDAFARLVRSVLQNSKEELITLEKELEALDLYISLEKLRFDQAFDHEFIIDPMLEVDFYQVPPLILQPYVENAIWHGLMPLKRKGKLTIRGHLEEDILKIEIEDDGVGRTKSEQSKRADLPFKKSMGMDITKGRMELQKELSGMHIGVQIKDLMDTTGKPTGTRVEIDIAYSE